MTKRLDEIIDEMFAVRARKRKLEAKVKDADAEYAELASEFIQTAKSAGTDYARGKLASASITKQLVPQARDWDEIYDYIRENDAMYLLHRRISAGAWKELLDSGTDVPGIEAYEKETVSLRELR